MSCVPPVNGRVNAIKSQFENLSTFDIKKSDKTTKSTNKFSFQRSATSIGFTVKSKKSSPQQQQVKPEISKKPQEFQVKKDFRRNSVVPDLSSIKSKQAKLEEENVDEIADEKLSRHTVDSVKRSSVRRSPAFRVGIEKPTKSAVRTSSVNSQSSESRKFQNFILEKCASADITKLQQPGLTDSIKYALKQPLPIGPPPKKPPRTFFATSSDDSESSPINSLNPTELFAEQLKKSPNKNHEINEKINYLENKLFKTTNPKKETSLSPQQQSPKTDHQQSSTFLDCLSCHKNSAKIYDSIIVDERKPLMQSNLNKSIIKHFANTIKPVEPIYMEPFSHLKTKSPDKYDVIPEEMQQIGNASTSGESNTEESLTETICSCPENHNDKNDMHYLCTAIENNIESSAETLDNDGNLSLDKTYDEITILVNAAFQKKKYDKENSVLNNHIQNYVDENFKIETTPVKRNSLSSVRLSRTLTEKRKDYVRRMSILPDGRQSYGSLQNTFKSPVIKTFSLEENTANKNMDDDENKMITNPVSLSDRIDNYNKLIIENSQQSSEVKMRTKKSCTNKSNEEINKNKLSDNDSFDDENDNSVKLFQVCLLIGYNTSTQSAYLKSKYPPNEPIPDNIEQLVFPSSELVRSGRENQEYCLILTDDTAFKIYGYCRRILPEDFDMCLPLCYCIITVTKALGFFQKLLKEIESRHGQSEAQMNFLLKYLQHSKLPEPGKYLHVKIPLTNRPKTFFSSNNKISPKRLSLEANPKWLKDSSLTTSVLNNNYEQNIDEQKRQKTGQKSLVQEYEEKKQQQQQQSNNIDFGLINRSLIVRDPKYDEILIRRPTDLRLENTEVSELLNSIGSELLVSVFATLLLERKVILQSRNISMLSKSILALQTIIYPFQWQYTIVTILPKSLIEICQAPFPVLAGIVDEIQFEIEDGIVVNLDQKKITQSCGDEQTILPDSLRQSLQLSLQMVDLIDQGKMLSGVLISEAFLRFFVELFGDYQQKQFNKDEFIQLHTSQNIKFFLDWFVETSMFRSFCNDKFPRISNSPNKQDEKNSFYDLFDARLIEKSENTKKQIENIETIVKNSKIINKKGKSLAKRLKEFINHN